MTLKTFYKNFEEQNFIEKKIFSNIIYSKHFVRSSSKFDNFIQILDNSSDFFFAINNLDLGLSFSPTKVIFRHKYDNRFRFNFFLNYNNVKDKSINKITSKLSNALQTVGVSNKCLIFLLRPVRGGFKAYSCGFLGFLPRGQAKLFFKKIWLIDHLRNVSFFSGSFFFLSKKHTFKFFFAIGVPFRFIKILIYPGFRSYGFSSSFAQRRSRFFKGNLNLVFLLQRAKKGIIHQKAKKKKFNYEDSTLKKKFKPAYNKKILSDSKLFFDKKSTRKDK